jgi:hypothetical protein
VKGQFATSPGTPDCELCEKGTIAAAKAATSCTDCDLGTVAIDPGSDECDDCLAGYVSTNNTLPCVECAKGQYQSAVAKTLCVACGPGYFSEVEHSSSVLNCEHCPAGKWSAIATGQCTACDKGKSMTNSTPWVGKTHEGHCENCPAGQFQEADGLTICENCPSGQWQSGTGNHTCRACVHLDSLRFDWTENMAGWKTPCVPHPLHCQHNDWATPSGEVCDKTCGDSGLLLQTRQVTQQEWGGGTACSTLDTQKFVECNRHACREYFWSFNCVLRKFLTCFSVLQPSIASWEIGTLRRPLELSIPSVPFRAAEEPSSEPGTLSASRDSVVPAVAPRRTSFRATYTIAVRVFLHQTLVPSVCNISSVFFQLSTNARMCIAITRRTRQLLPTAPTLQRSPTILTLSTDDHQPSAQ